MTRAATVGRVVRVGRVESTQSVAFALAAEGAADRTVVVADSHARCAYGSWGAAGVRVWQVTSR